MHRNKFCSCCLEQVYIGPNVRTCAIRDVQRWVSPKWLVKELQTHAKMTESSSFFLHDVCSRCGLCGTSLKTKNDKRHPSKRASQRLAMNSSTVRFSCGNPKCSTRWKEYTTLDFKNQTYQTRLLQKLRLVAKGFDGLTKDDEFSTRVRSLIEIRHRGRERTRTPKPRERRQLPSCTNARLVCKKKGRSMGRWVKKKLFVLMNGLLSLFHGFLWMVALPFLWVVALPRRCWLLGGGNDNDDDDNNNNSNAAETKTVIFRGRTRHQERTMWGSLASRTRLQLKGRNRTVSTTIDEEERYGTLRRQNTIVWVLNYGTSDKDVSIHENRSYIIWKGKVLAAGRDRSSDLLVAWHGGGLKSDDKDTIETIALYQGGTKGSYVFGSLARARKWLSEHNEHKALERDVLVFVGGTGELGERRDSVCTPQMKTVPNMADSLIKPKMVKVFDTFQMTETEKEAAMEFEEGTEATEHLPLILKVLGCRLLMLSNTEIDNLKDLWKQW